MDKIKVFIYKHVNFVNIILLFVLGLVAFWSNLGNQLFWDDAHYILANDYVTNLNLENVVRIFSENSIAGAGLVSDYYRPIQLLVYGIIYKIVGSDTLLYHLVANLLHIANSILIYCFVKHIFKKNTVLAFLVSMFFLLHPTNSETVTYISSLDTVLSSFFVFSAIFAYFNGIKIVSLLLFVLAIFSRETTLVFPVYLLGLSVVTEANWPYSFKYFRGLFKKILPFILISVLFIILRLGPLNFDDTLSLTSTGSAAMDLYSSNISVRIITFFASITEYLRVVFVPSQLHFRMEPKIFTSWLNPKVVTGMLFVVLSLGFCIYLYVKKHKYFRILFFGLSFFYGNLLFTSGVVIPLHLIFEEHWIYLSIFGLMVPTFHFLIKIYEILKIRFGNSISYICVIALLAYFGYFFMYLTERNRMWGDPVVLWEDMLKYEKGHPRLVNELGVLHGEKGNHTKAEYNFRQAIEDDPGFVEPHLNLGQSLLAQKRYPEAAESYENALRIDHKNETAITQLAKVAGIRNKRGEVIKYLLMLLQIRPDDPSVYYNLAFVYASTNEYENALKYISDGLKLNDQEFNEKFNDLKNQMQAK